MKKIALPVLILALALAGCGTAKSPSSGRTGNVDPSTRTLPPLTRDVVGIFKLEGTPQAVTASQAKQLLPLWEVYSSLTQSGTAAQAEIDGLTQQIEQSLTPAQTKAIQDMNLTGRDLFAVMQQQGINFGGPRANGTPSPNRSGSNGGGVPPAGGFQGGGNFRDGGFPGGGFFQRSGTPGANSSRTGSSQPRPEFARIPTPLLNALIGFLKKRAGS
ncbi:MAG: hypothetical protein ACM3QS_07975 [Bacteroidota bacterium]